MADSTREVGTEVNDETPEQTAARQIAEQDQAAAQLRGMAEAVVTVHQTLCKGGVSSTIADQMVLRFWCQIFPGQPSPFGFLFQQPPPPS